jgi:hypothetical protein
MPHTKARRIQSFKFIDRAKGIEEHKIWDVPVDEKDPDGIRYRLAYIPAGRETPSVLYDNHYPKGHHKHIEGRETGYEFSGVENLIRDFHQDIEALK